MAAGQRRPHPDGVLALTLPMDDKKLPGIAADDIGKCALGVFKRGAELIGKTVGIAGEHLNGAEMASALASALGRDVRHLALSPAQYRGFGFPGADDLGNMFQYKRDFEADFRAQRDVDATRRLNPRLQSFAQWLEDNIERMPVA